MVSNGKGVDRGHGGGGGRGGSYGRVGHGGSGRGGFHSGCVWVKVVVMVMVVIGVA